MPASRLVSTCVYTVRARRGGALKVEVVMLAAYVAIAAVVLGVIAFA
jgi:hypothetical protein